MLASKEITRKGVYSLNSFSKVNNLSKLSSHSYSTLRSQSINRVNNISGQTSPTKSILEHKNEAHRFFRTFIKQNYNNKNNSIPQMRFSEGFQKYMSTGAQTSSTGTTNSTVNLSESDTQKLNELLKHADEFPNDPVSQYNYLSELNRLSQFQTVIDRYEQSNKEGGVKLTFDDLGRKEYIKSLVHLNHLDKHPISTLLGLDSTNPASSNQPGSSSSTPIFTQRVTDRFSHWVQTGYNLTIILFCLFAIYWFMTSSKSGGGGLGELLNNNIQSVEEMVTNTFADVKGSDEAKEELSDIVEYLKNPNKFASMGAKLPKGILLVGPPGCGKTLLAKALAGEAGVPFYYTSGSEFEEMLVGVGARRVRALFNKAKESAPCIIFIDEIDAVGGKRDAFDTRTSKMSLNQLLVEMDGFSPSAGVVVVAATNMPDTLDSALTRPGRFDRQVSVDLPDIKARKEILDMYLGKHKAKDVDTDQLAKATVGFSGADLFNMVNTALIAAVKRNMFSVNNNLLIHAKETVQMGPERKSLTLTPETKKITAFHEAGHALISFVHKKSIVKATLVPRGHALGMVSYLPKDEMLTKKEDLLNQLDTAMGGRVAEELIFGENKVTQGAGSDFRQATRIAYTMVANYGMSDKLGHFSFSDSEYRNLSPEARGLIDAEVKVILEESYQRAKKMLITHKAQLTALANALLEYETLNEEEVRLAFEGKDLKSYKDAKREEEELLKRVIVNRPPFTKDGLDVTLPPTSPPTPPSKPNIQ